MRSDNLAGPCPNCLTLGTFDCSDSSAESETQTIATETGEAIDDDFGRYRILRRLGEGGMGSVYLAEQFEPIRRHVALKVVKLGMDTAQVLVRFKNERQALAMMDHPNVAKIFDAGATTKGRPYFVMEYIEGAPVTHYCDRKRMTTKERLALFVTVCRAVQHAHQKGVIHRDLKPSNILVTEQDGQPVPKVIDFGIAKATGRWTAGNTLHTQFGNMVGTPEYASPEQADTMTGEIDEASDVYSLGVVLYELLIGAVPFDIAALRKSGLAEMLRVIREEEAPSLREKFTSLGEATNDIAARRRTDAVSLRRLVDGDLNSITMKALEKTRERRYTSVSDLAADIQRYMDDRPVLASQAGWRRRTQKFLRRHKVGAAGTIAGVSLLALMGVTVWSLMHRGSVSGSGVTATDFLDKKVLVLADFDNTTGDPSFDGALRRVLSGELGMSPDFSVLSDSRIKETLRLMVRNPDTKLTPEIGSEICERTGSAAVVEGSIALIGNHYAVDLRARNCRTGDVLDEERTQAAGKEDVLKALGQVAAQFKLRASESIPRVKKEPSLRADVTTPSLEAWRSFSASMKAVQSKAVGAETRALLKRATELDPQFAMAYARLGFDDPETAAVYIPKAYALRDRVSDWENFYITFIYNMLMTGNLELARQTLESWAQKYPNNVEVHGLLSGFTSQGMGRYEIAAEEGQKAVGLDPDFAIGYLNTAWAYVYQNRLTEAEAVLKKASDRKIDIFQFSLCRYVIALLRGDSKAMETEIARRNARFGVQGQFEHQQALSLASAGRLKEAAVLADRAVSLSRHAGRLEQAAMFQGAQAVWEALFGLRDQAQANANAAVHVSPRRDPRYGAVLALALLGDSAEAHKVEVDLDKTYPEDTCVQFSYLPTLRALEALKQGDAAKALKMTQPATPYELGVPAIAYYARALFGALYPVYVRGLAYSRMRRHAEAAAEFQKILDHPGVVADDPIRAMARLEFARALSTSGDRAKSTAAYKDLLTLWKDADPDIPTVQNARAEFAKLQ